MLTRWDTKVQYSGLEALRKLAEYGIFFWRRMRWSG